MQTGHKHNGAHTVELQIRKHAWGKTHLGIHRLHLATWSILVRIKSALQKSSKQKHSQWRRGEKRGAAQQQRLSSPDRVGENGKEGREWGEQEEGGVFRCTDWKVCATEQMWIYCVCIVCVYEGVNWPIMSFVVEPFFMVVVHTCLNSSSSDTLYECELLLWTVQQFKATYVSNGKYLFSLFVKTLAGGRHLI